MSKNPKNRWKLMKLANIEREILHVFWTTWGIPMKFSGKTWLMIILKVTTNQRFILFLEDTFFEKPQGGSTSPPAVLGLIFVFEWCCSILWLRFFYICPHFWWYLAILRSAHKFSRVSAEIYWWFLRLEKVLLSRFLNFIEK